MGDDFDYGNYIISEVICDLGSEGDRKKVTNSA
jgi:hypothetical protein